jgi:hypothetical protein
MTTVLPAVLKDMKQKWISGDKAEFFDVLLDNGRRPMMCCAPPQPSLPLCKLIPRSLADIPVAPCNITAYVRSSLSTDAASALRCRV